MSVEIYVECKILSAFMFFNWTQSVYKTLAEFVNQNTVIYLITLLIT